MTNFVTLSCPSCGAKLEITKDLERFACSSCGNEHFVRRSGGIVSLSPVVNAINQVKTGVDKTAAELAIARIQKEINDLVEQKNKITESYIKPDTYGCGPGMLFLAGAIVFMIGLSVGDNGSIFIILLGVLIAATGTIPYLTINSRIKVWGEQIRSATSSLDKKIAENQNELEKYKDIVKL